MNNSSEYDTSEDSNEDGSFLLADHVYRQVPETCTASAKPRVQSFTRVKRATLMLTAENERFRQKYRRIKRQIKDLVVENAALCDAVTEIQQSVTTAETELEALKERLSQKSKTSAALRQSVEKQKIPVKRSKKEVDSTIAPTHTGAKTTQNADSVGKQGSKGRNVQRSTKGRTAANQKKLVELIPLDPNGTPIFPMALSGCNIHGLGEIDIKRPAYHTQDFLFPIGFCSTRYFASSVNPFESVLYTCMILDGGVEPQFEITSENTCGPRYASTSIDACFGQLLRDINAHFEQEIIPVVPRGAAFFGLSIPTVHNLIQGCLGSRKCSKYRWVKYEVRKEFKDSSHVQDPYLCFDAFKSQFLSKAIC